MVQKVLNGTNAESTYIKLRREAEAADKEYRVSVRKLDRQRLGLEERIEETLKTLQKWELDRLRAVKTGMFTFLRLHQRLQRLIEVCAYLQFCISITALSRVFQKRTKVPLNDPRRSSRLSNPKQISKLFASASVLAPSALNHRSMSLSHMTNVTLFSVST